MFKNIKIRTKLILSSLFISLLPLVVFTYIGLKDFTETLIKETKSRYFNEAAQSFNAIDMVMQEHYHNIYSFSQSPIFQEEYSISEITERMKKWQEQYHYESLSYFNTDRIRLADTEGIGIGKQHPLEGFWHKVLKGEISAGDDTRLGPERKIPIIYFAAPVKNQVGQQIGVIVARMKPKQLQAVFAAAAAAAAADIHINLLDKNGNIIFTTSPFYEDKIFEKIPEDFYSVKEALAGRDGTVEEYMPHYQKEFITAYIHEKGFDDFNGNDWSIIVSISKDTVLASATALRNKLIFIILIFIVLTLVLGVLFSQTIAKPIKDLSKTAQIITEGDLIKRAEVKSKDEIGQLAASFNQMTDSLIKTMEEKRKTEVAAAAAAAARLEAIEEGKKYIENIMTVMPTSLIVITPQAKIESVNPITLEILGYKEKELIGQPIDKILGAAAAAAADSVLKEIGLTKLVKQGNAKDIRMFLRAKNNENIPVSVSGSILKDEKGKEQSIVLIAKDLRELKNYTRKKLSMIMPVLKKVSMGDFSENIKLPEEGDECMEAFVALNSMIDKLRETVGKNVELVKELEKEKSNLEQRVKERTMNLDAANQQLKATNQQIEAANQQLAAAQAQLQDKIVELERFNKITMGRELKILELKEEVARLKNNKNIKTAL